VINARSPNKAAATRFLRWLTEPQQQVRLANGMNSLPVSRRASNSPALESHLRRFVPYLNYVAIDLRYHEDPQVLSTLYRGVRNVIAGRSTPRSVLETTQRVAR
jgi:maltose-binding protein MalE